MLQRKLTNNFNNLLSKMRKSRLITEKTIMDMQETATLLALETAINKTPPSDGDEKIRGTGTITGTLKSAWSRDSITASKKVNGNFITVLKNNEEYASYVNDGHIMDKHFVPGLIINPYSGLLEKMPEGMEGGITVGTKTKYVVGKYMKENALITYYKAMDTESKKLLDLFEGL